MIILLYLFRLNAIFQCTLVKMLNGILKHQQQLLVKYYRGFSYILSPKYL